MNIIKTDPVADDDGSRIWGDYEIPMPSFAPIDRLPIGDSKTPNVLRHACVWIPDPDSMVPAGPAPPKPKMPTSDDHWYVDENFLVKVHLKPCPPHLVVPDDALGWKPNKNHLCASRLTIGYYIDSGKCSRIENDWKCEALAIRPSPLSERASHAKKI